MKNNPSAIALFFLFISAYSFFGCDSDQSKPTGEFANTAPQADAGPDQSVATGTTVTLDGSGSSDSDGDLLAYTWTFISRPGSSGSVFSNLHSAAPTFVPDQTGTYVIQLVVSDGETNSSPNTMTVTATAASQNLPPVANAGPDQNVTIGTAVVLDGTASFDVNGDALTYTWSLLSKPDASSAVLSSAAAMSPQFTADIDGSYEIQLIVNDGNADSPADTVTVVAASPVVAHVPDTGQTSDFTATWGEDADYTIHPPSYTDNGNETITDNVTGLMWQKQDDGITRDWTTAMNYCETLSVAGYYDWRLPSNKELIGIVHYGTSGPAIDTAYFPSTYSSGYWTSTYYLVDPNMTVDVEFDFGVNHTATHNRTNGAFYSRCVRGAQTNPFYINNGDGTITDQSTRLMWQQNDDAIQRAWESAVSYCEGLDLAGHSDWRLPNLKELLSIVDYSIWAPAIDSTYFPTTQATRYWASTSKFSSTTLAWDISFMLGNIETFNKSHGSYYARCVRGGE